ncbi:hypothetical protein BSK20_02350 [SR1 bacterium human oral taxon HOT-345]|nr:hypothetical protein BSK20_02350 [SR1 bacterium human oral taxon HOT-345]
MSSFFDRFCDKILNVWTFLMKNMKSLSYFSLFGPKKGKSDPFFNFFQHFGQIFLYSSIFLTV